MECPKCHHKIGKFDWRQNCKNCGVNLMYYRLEENMAEDAKATELSFAKTRIFSAKMKAVFVGGALQIVRLVMLLGCIGILMIPFAKLSVSTALYENTFKFDFLSCYNAISGGTLDKIGSLTESAVFGDIAAKVLLLYYVILALAVIGILQLLFVIISMAKPRAFSGVVAAISVIGIGDGIFSIIVMSQLKAVVVGAVVAYNSGFGAYAAIIGFIVMLVLNLIMAIKGIDIKYKPGDLYRIDIGKKVKAGQVKLADLPLPIFETEEEKAERLAEIEQAAQKEEVTNG